MYRKKMMIIFAVFIVIIVAFMSISSRIIMKNNQDNNNGITQVINPDGENAPQSVDYPGKPQTESDNQNMNNELPLPQADDAEMDNSEITPVIPENRPGVSRTIQRHYLDKAIGQEQLRLWNRKSFPLRVYIQNEAGLPERYADGIKTGFNNWQNASNEFVTFTYVDVPQHADIIVNIANQPLGCGKFNENARASYDVSNNKLSKVILEIPQTSCEGKPITEADVYVVVQHQIGHILGINGHSDRSADVMNGNATYENINISDIDIATLKFLYKFAPEITNIPFTSVETKKMYKVNQVRGKSLDFINKYLSSQGEGQQNLEDPLDIAIKSANGYYKNKNYPQALRFYRKALDLAEDPHSKAYIYYSMAVTDLELGNSGEALSYASKAYEWAESPANAYLIAYINFQTGQEERAQEQLEYIIQNYPKVRNAYSLLGQIYVKNKQTEKLRELSKKAEENFPGISPIKIKN